MAYRVFPRGVSRKSGIWWTSVREARVVLLGALALGLGVVAVERGGGDAAASPDMTRTTGSARFSICGSAKRIDCVVDGDTFWMDGAKIRIADIDTPETHPPRCAAEAKTGRAATLRMQALLNAGPFALVPIRRDVDRYGRKLRRVERDGTSLGAVLVGEGLARDYGGGKRAGWCAAG